MVRQQFAKLRPRKGSCGFDPHTLRHEMTVTLVVTVISLTPAGVGIERGRGGAED